MTELFVYYQVPRAHAAAAAAQLRQAQAGLAQRRPGLQCRLLWRCDAPASADLLTCMETYAAAPGLDDAALQAIDAALADLPSHRRGPRHRELFDARPPAQE